MKSTENQDEALLLKTATAVCNELTRRKEGTSLRMRKPNKVSATNTGGWRAPIGDLGKGQPRLELWFDYFAAKDVRRFNFCFFSEDLKKIHFLAERYVLSEPLHQNESGAAILEEYWRKYFFYGVYDLSDGARGTKVDPKVCARAADFYEDVARAMPHAKERDPERDIYVGFEGRKKVTLHLGRERDGYLPTLCKIRDNYRCQVCGLRFEDHYGKLGEYFAEAHHRVPLGSLRTEVKTRVKDLATVCANCHRMLHRMEGKKNDVEKLKAIYFQNHRTR